MKVQHQRCKRSTQKIVLQRLSFFFFFFFYAMKQVEGHREVKSTVTTASAGMIQKRRVHRIAQTHAHA